MFLRLFLSSGAWLHCTPYHTPFICISKNTGQPVLNEVFSVHVAFFRSCFLLRFLLSLSPSMSPVHFSIRIDICFARRRLLLVFSIISRHPLESILAQSKNPYRNFPFAKTTNLTSSVFLRGFFCPNLTERIHVVCAPGLFPIPHSLSYIIFLKSGTNLHRSAVLITNV